MAYKHILVHLDSGPQVEARLDSAIALAKGSGAFLRGLFAQPDRSATSIIARRSSDHLEQAAARSEAMFRDKLQTSGLEGQWHGLTHGEHNHVIRETIIWSRFADLTVLGQFDRTAGDGIAPEELNEQVVLNSGRPVLVLPFAGTFPVDRRHRDVDDADVQQRHERRDQADAQRTPAAPAVVPGVLHRRRRPALAHRAPH